MIDRRTVFVLGAGASVPFGFPSGRQLLIELADVCMGRGRPAYNLPLQAGFSSEDLVGFATALLESNLPSVDLFLERRPEFMSLGKLALAAHLAPCEDPAQLRRGAKTSWFEYIYRAMDAPRDLYRGNQVSFVTFNYDRCLEQLFYVSLKSTFGLSDAEWVKLMSSIPIVHVYGSLGPFPYVSGNGRAFTPDVDLEVARECAKGIRILHEGAEDDPSFQDAFGHMKSAEIVCFLGFGYHPVNMQRLGIAALGEETTLLGCAFGMTQEEQQRVKRTLERDITLGAEGQDALQFMRWHRVFE